VVRVDQCTVFSADAGPLHWNTTVSTPLERVALARGHAGSIADQLSSGRWSKVIVQSSGSAATATGCRCRRYPP